MIIDINIGYINTIELIREPAWVIEKKNGLDINCKNMTHCCVTNQVLIQGFKSYRS